MHLFIQFVDFHNRAQNSDKEINNIQILSNAYQNGRVLF